MIIAGIIFQILGIIIIFGSKYVPQGDFIIAFSKNFYYGLSSIFVGLFLILFWVYKTRKSNESRIQGLEGRVHHLEADLTHHIIKEDKEGE